MWHVYILLCNDTSIYTGVTTNVPRRFYKHLKGAGAAYTASHPPICIVYTERFTSKSLAFKREYEIKQWSRTKKIYTLRLDL